MSDDVVCFLRQCESPGNDDHIITIAHVMQSAQHTIVKCRFMPYTIAIHEERISPLLIVSNHSFAKRLVVHHSFPV